MEHITHAIQDDYPDEFAHCFGCGRLNEAGHHIRTGWQETETVTIYEPKKNIWLYPDSCTAA